MKILFKDLVDIPALKQMVQANFNASGMPAGIIDAVSGEVYAGAGRQRICTRFHRKNPESLKLCIEGNTRITGKLAGGGAYTGKCGLGLRNIGVPIFCGNTYSAAIFFCQFLYEGEKAYRDFFLDQADRFGFPPDDYLAALDEVPVFSAERAAAILDYNTAFAAFLSTLATERMRYHHERACRKKAEASLKKVKSGLKRQIEARAGELKDTAFELESLFKGSQVGMMVTGADQIILKGNPRLADMLGYASFNEMAGLAFKSLYLTEERFHQFRVAYDPPLSRGETVRAEYELRRKDGTKAWFSLSGRVLDRWGPEVTSGKVLWIVDDIGDRKRMEIDLREKEEHYRTIFEQFPDAVILINPKTQKAIDFNDLSPMMLGYSREEFADLKISDYEAAESPEEVEKHIRDIITRGRGRFETRLRARDGSIKNVFVNSRVIEMKGETVFHSIFHDITEQKRAEALQRFQAQIMSQIHDSVIAVDLDGLITSWNRGSENLFGYSGRKIIGKPISTLYPADSHALLFEEIIPTLLSKGSHELETTLVRKGGERFWARISLSVLRDDSGKITGMIGYSLDISDRRMAEERFETFFSLVPDILCIADINGYFRMINPAATEILGFSIEELLGTPFMDYVYPDDREKTLKIIKEKLDQGQTVLNFENRYICSDGSIKWLEWNSHPIPDRNITYAVARDCTQRIKLEAALKKSELWLRNIFNSLEEAVLVVSPERMLISVNRAVETIFGYRPEELLGKSTEILHVDADHYTEFGRRIQNAFDQAKPAEFEFEAKRKSGEVFPTEHTVSLLQDESGRSLGIVSVIRDITERKQIEKLMNIQIGLGTALGSVEELAKALTLFLYAALAAGDFDFGGVYTVDPLTGDLNLVVHKGIPPELENACRRYDSGSLYAKLVVKGKPRFQSYDKFMDDFSMTPGEEDLRVRLGLRSVAVVPVLYNGKAIASLDIVSKKKDYIPDFTRHALEAIAFQAAGALARIYAGQALRASRQNLQSLFQSMDNFLFVLNSSGMVIGFNPVAESRLGYPAEELLGKSFIHLHPPDRRREAKTAVKNMMGGRAGLSVIPFLTREGKQIPVETRITLGPWDNREALFCVSWDISERLEAERARKESEDRLLTAIETIDEGFVLFDAEGRLVLFNAKFSEIYKESAALIKPGVLFEDILRDGIKKGLYEDAKEGEKEWIKHRMFMHRSAAAGFEQKLSDGRRIRITQKRMKGGGTVGFMVDITDIRKSEELAREALKEKESLLREIHHRVKNNLQVVSSLISLQSGKIKDPIALNAFMDMEIRVRSMAFVHEILYRSDRFSQIRLQDYLDNLLTHLLHVYAFGAASADIQADAGDVVLNIDHAVPFGLIVTELVTNSFKYGMPPGGTGLVILVKITRGADCRLTLKVMDNGSGLPRDFDPETGSTLGIKLVTELVTDQLEGQWRLDHETGGTSWVISWPMIDQGMLI